MNVEHFSYRLGSATNRLGRPPAFYRSVDLPRSGNRFCSVYSVRLEDARAIAETAGSAYGFKGVVWARRLWIDFDDEGAAQRAQEKLKHEGYDFVAYHTGGRGMHLGVLRAALPSHVLPWQDKRWVAENVPGADLSLYWHLHLIRLPGAIHEKTGRPKVLVGKFPGKELLLPPFVEPKDEERSGPLGQAQRTREGLFTNWGVAELLTPEPGTGRHKHLVKLALALRDAGAMFDEALWMVFEVNRGFNEPKGSEEVRRIVRWSYGLEG